MRRSHLLMCSLAVWVLVGIVPNAIAQEKKTETQKTKTGAAAYNDFKEPYRTQFVDQWKKAVEDGKQGVIMMQERITEASRHGVYIGGTPGNDDGRRVSITSQAGKAGIRKMKDDLKMQKERLKKLEKNDPPFINIPTARLPREPRAWGVGDTGEMARNVKIIQVVSKDKLLISVPGLEVNSRDRLVMLFGFPTERITDGCIWSFDEPIEITGTTTYATANGSTNTVLKAVPAKPFDRDAYIKSLKREKP